MIPTYHSPRTILCPVCHLSQRDCSHNHGPAYAIIDLRTQERGTFTTAHDVAMFMWGRDFRHYRILRRGERFPWLDGDLAAFERALESC